MTDAQPEMKIDPARAKALVSQLQAVQERVAAVAAGRNVSPPFPGEGHTNPDSAQWERRTLTTNPKVRLVAVSKLKPANDVLALHQASPPQVHFGENYAQELGQKAEMLPRSIQWHFIGGLQSTHAKKIAKIPNLFCVSSVDTLKKAQLLNSARADLVASDPSAGPLGVHVQVNTSGEESKSGAAPGDETVALCRAVEAECPSLTLLGLMTIGAIARSRATTPENENEDFLCLREQRDLVRKELGLERELELSMGMSEDFEGAVRLGSGEEIDPDFWALFEEYDAGVDNGFQQPQQYLVPEQQQSIQQQVPLDIALPTAPQTSAFAFQYPIPEEQSIQQQLPFGAALPTAPQNPEAALEAYTAPLRPNNKNNKVKKEKGPSKRPVGKDSCDACKRSKVGCIRNGSGECTRCAQKKLPCTTTGRDKRTNTAVREAYKNAFEECCKYQAELHTVAEWLCKRLQFAPTAMAAKSLTMHLDIDARLYMCCNSQTPSNLIQEVNQLRLPPRREDSIVPALTESLKLKEMRQWFDKLQQRFRLEVALLAKILVALTDQNAEVRQNGYELFSGLYANGYYDFAASAAEISIDDKYGVIDFHTRAVDDIIAKHRT
ncbi:alanine racemase family protein [Colletotrichum karsti]|uniref:Pyridoxal phosphate homeostasis protein n=1 Tax=Colletotrichum karsti TaxID=1095194 RepID=A0A9P6LLV8_9PEZI|nr:alanine racemase family protein [Colletotrichum karsti]KAF9877546.1 alanine racemase family protein [Colletotrichum karsti]